ncbi:hypothetical protein IEO21_03719 [Rhodonia placenta]|uniref:Cytochrome P450 n=1 Tax=Rhodonia placenta TaxID=104341 RepID=A0A8H7P558_9APHY|nr:hypothetical protein IEO21_03719 [Postia placenta]
MNASFDPQTVAAVVALGLLCRWLLALWYNTVNLPPGPTGLPFLGNVHQIPLQYPHKTLYEWGQRYGDIIHARLFQKHVLVLDSTKAAEDLLDKRAAKYSDRPHFTLLEDLLQWKPLMVFMSQGETFRLHRKWYQSFLENRQSLRTYESMQQREVDSLLLALLESPENVAYHLKRFTGSLMLEIAYGYTETSEKDAYIRLASETITQSLEAGTLVASLVDFFPILLYLPHWFPGGGFKSNAMKLHGRVWQIMESPFRYVQQAIACSTARPSFTSFMIDQTAKEGQLTEEDELNIKGAAILMYSGQLASYGVDDSLNGRLELGGTDTTNTALLTLLLAIALHPEVLRKAQAEIDEKIGPSRLPTLEDRASLPYVECIVKEAYRWNPVLPAGIPHQLREDDEYRGYHIPRGSMVISNIWQGNDAGFRNLS